MTRDEAVRENTVERFLECEAKRAEARAAAQAEGKSDRDARGIAHEAAKAHWNAWAEALNAERKAMEESGAWAAEKDLRGTLQPKNEGTRAWMDKAEANFSRCLFLVKGSEGTKEAAGEEKEELEAGAPPVKSIVIDAADVDMRAFVFPGVASFGSATFSGGASFGSATFSGGASFGSATFSGGASFGSATFSGGASFDSATFSGDASFDSATFSGGASFGSATFSGGASFGSATFSGGASFGSATFSGGASFVSATFSGGASFDSATFSGDASFVSATFSGDAWFGSATFSGGASFDSATFSGDAWFGSATFSGDAWFVSATFSGGASFGSATFTKSTAFCDAKFGTKEKRQEADFTAIKVERAFDLTGARFSKAPGFSQADFKQAPDLDGVEFPLPSRWPWRFGDPAVLPKYRAIRRMAIQGADYEREQMAFKGELRSRRWTTDKLWHPGLWLGIFYDVFADCGRSIFRPALVWLASVFVFAVIYLRMADPLAWTCGAPFVKALFLSGRNALVLFSGSRDARIGQAYRCLYGGDGEPDIPDAVSFLEAFVQVPLSAALIFLVLLAVKNRFKIK